MCRMVTVGDKEEGYGKTIPPAHALTTNTRGRPESRQPECLGLLLSSKARGC